MITISNEFKNLIIRYQNNGERKIIEKILNCTDYDLHISSSRKVIDKGSYYIGERKINNSHMLRKSKKIKQFKPNKRKVYIELSTPEEYIAYRIKAFTKLIDLFEGKESKQKKKYEELSADYEEDIFFYSSSDYGNYEIYSYEDLECIIYDLDIDRFTKKNFDIVKEIFLQDVRHIREIKDLHPKQHYEDLWENLDCVREVMEYNYNAFIKLLKYYTDESKKIVKENIKPNINTNEKINSIKTNEIVIQALEYALLKVDINRNEKEIVKYVNKLWTTQYIKLSERKYKNIDIDVWIFGKTTKVLGDKMKLLFQERQLEFIQKVEDTLRSYQVKRRLGNKMKYLVPNKREVANLLGVEESNFKHRLRRIKNKVLDNWEDLMKS